MNLKEKIQHYRISKSETYKTFDEIYEYLKKITPKQISIEPNSSKVNPSDIYPLFEWIKITNHSDCGQFFIRGELNDDELFHSDINKLVEQIKEYANENN